MILNSSLQTGITVIDNISHHGRRRFGLGRMLERGKRRTVDCNGNGFGQFIAVCSHERGDLAELVELQVFEAGLFSVDGDFLKVKLVRLGDSFDGNGAWVTLQQRGCVSNER